jgi:hypothetical protein
MFTTTTLALQKPGPGRGGREEENPTLVNVHILITSLPKILNSSTLSLILKFLTKYFPSRE